MELFVYFKSSSLRGTGVQIASKKMVTALPLLLVIAIGGCEISPEQVKFRDPVKSDETKVALCQGDDCPDTALPSVKDGPPVH
jgi:hypothetical protein